MITDVCQRWRGRRASYRPAGEVIDPRRYEVAPIDTDTEARAFVVAHHYSASYPAARVRVGLYRAGALVGVAVFSVPAQAKALDVLPCDRDEAVELGRLVLLDDVAGNGESWFVAQAFAELRRRGFAGVLSFSDPIERRAADGALVKPGHRGVVYQALPRVATGCRPARDALGRPPAAPARRAPEASVTPITVTRDAPTLSAVLAAVGWRRTDGVVYDEDGAPVCALWWQAWAALYERGILAPDDEMRASCERHAAQARAWS